MRLWTSLPLILPGGAAPAPAQPFDLAHQMLPAHGRKTASISLGDGDGDGDVDAFLGAGATSILGVVWPNHPYLNDGAGLFADATSSNLPANLGQTEAVALCDVDGDGDLDAYVGDSGYTSYPWVTGRQNRLYLDPGGRARVALLVPATPGL